MVFKDLRRVIPYSEQIRIRDFTDLRTLYDGMSMKTPEKYNDYHIIVVTKTANRIQIDAQQI